LYLFGGIANDPKKIREVNDVKPFFWKLDLPTMTWEKMGTYNSALVSSQYNSIQIKDKLYLFNEILLEVDFEQNTVKKYDYSNHIVPKAMLVKNDTIYGIFEKNNGKIYFSKKTINEIKGKYLGSESFLVSKLEIHFKEYGLLGAAMLILLISLIVYLKKRK
jgi:hypothetical protein